MLRLSGRVWPIKELVPDSPHLNKMAEAVVDFDACIDVCLFVCLFVCYLLFGVCYMHKLTCACVGNENQMSGNFSKEGRRDLLG